MVAWLDCQTYKFCLISDSWSRWSNVYVTSGPPAPVVSSDIGIQASQSDVSPEGSIPVMCPAVLTQQLYPQKDRTAPDRYRP